MSLLELAGEDAGRDGSLFWIICMSKIRAVKCLPCKEDRIKIEWPACVFARVDILCIVDKNTQRTISSGNPTQKKSKNGPLYHRIAINIDHNVKHLDIFSIPNNFISFISTSSSKCAGRGSKFSLCSRRFSTMLWVTRAGGCLRSDWRFFSLSLCSSSSRSLEAISIRLAFCLSRNSLQNSGNSGYITCCMFRIFSCRTNLLPLLIYRQRCMLSF